MREGAHGEMAEIVMQFFKDSDAFKYTNVLCVCVFC